MEKKIFKVGMERQYFALYQKCRLGLVSPLVPGGPTPPHPIFPVALEAGGSSAWGLVPKLTPLPTLDPGD